MKNVTLSEQQFEILSNLLKKDAEDLAREPEFLKECGDNPKEYIDERIELCRLFEFDFWNIIDLYCNHFILERLKVLYEGRSEKEFTQNYIAPSQPEILRGLFKALSKAKEKHN